MSELLDLGLEFSSCFAEPAVIRPSLAVRLGMKRSAVLCGTRIVVLPALAFLDLSLDGVVVLGPVPTRVKSDTPTSMCFGERFDLAMLDFGVCA